MLLPNGALRLLPDRLGPLGLLPDRLLGLRWLRLVSYLISPADVIKGAGGHAADGAWLLFLDAPGLLPGGPLLARSADLLFAGALLFPKLLFAGLLLLAGMGLFCLLALPLALLLDGTRSLLLLGLSLALDLLLPLRLSLPLDFALLLHLPLALRLPLLFSLPLSFLFLPGPLLLLLARALFCLTLLLFTLLLLALLPVALVGLPALLLLLLVLLAVGCLDVIERTCGRRLGRRRWRQQRRPQRDAPPSPGLLFHRCSSAARAGGCMACNVIHCLHVPDPWIGDRFH